MGELLSFVTSGSRGWTKYYSDDGAPFIRIGDLQRGTLSVAWQSAQRVNPPATTESIRTRTLPGDVLVSITADLGILGVVPEGVPEVYVNQHVALARPTSAVLPRYLGWYLDSESGGQRQFRELRRGETKAGLGLDDIRSIERPLPSLDHQREVVAALEAHFSRLDAAVASLTRAQANVKRARASVLKAAVEGRLVPTEAALARAEGRDYEPASVLLGRILAERRAAWAASGVRGKYKEPVGPETEGLPGLPEGWCWATMDALLYGIEAGKSFVADSTVPVAHEVGIVKVSAVTWGDYNEDEAKTVHDPCLINPDYFIRRGDLLMSRANTIELVGAVVIAERVTRHTMLSDKILRLNLPAAFRRWALWVLRSQHGRRQVEALATGNQESMRNIGQDRIRQIAIPLPPLAEQHRIVAEVDRRLSVLDALDTTLDATLARCARLRQSILKHAFDGRLVLAEEAGVSPRNGADTTTPWQAAATVSQDSSGRSSP
ncbi:hypothetical protein L6R50_06490 [Myxococcota bacterium]|nr:hypothetical protein [Myxococcota bacterium]